MTDEEKLKRIECILTVIFVHSFGGKWIHDENGNYPIQRIVKMIDGSQMIAREIIKRYEEQLRTLDDNGIPT